jgi:hypothetical protein
VYTARSDTSEPSHTLTRVAGLTGVGDWNRNYAPARVCACGHPDTMHDMTDPKGRPRKVQRCNLVLGELGEPCPCPSYDLTIFEWREHRVVIEVWKPSA